MVASKKEKPIIEVKHLSKQYGIGVDRTYKTLCDSLTSAVRNPLKTLKGCRRQNDTFWALKDVNFEVEKGEVVGIIGRNGAGKSTLLKVLSRITYPTEGEVRLRGRVGSLLEVGTGFHPELTGRENIYFNGAILGMKKREIDDKFDEIVKFAGVEKFLDTPVKRYSSGMQVRLAFSVAAHLDPEILVVDEVLAVGDAAFQKKCLGKMGEVAEGGRTVLFVSHNMEAIRRLCSRAIYLDSGRLLMDAPTKNAIDKYLDSGYTTDTEFLVDSPSQNIPVYLTKVRIEKSDGVPYNGFSVNTPWQARIYIRVEKEIDGLIIGIETNRAGIPLNVTWSHPFDLSRGSYEITFTENSVNYAPGIYSLHIGLSRYGQITYQKIENAGIVVIENVGTDGLSEAYRFDKGYIINQMAVKLGCVSSEG